jgi:hypothetical protein
MVSAAVMAITKWLISDSKKIRSNTHGWKRKPERAGAFKVDQMRKSRAGGMLL